MSRASLCYNCHDIKVPKYCYVGASLVMLHDDKCCMRVQIISMTMYVYVYESQYHEYDFMIDYLPTISGSGSGIYSGGLTWSIVLRCDDHTGIFTCDGCARDPYFYVLASPRHRAM